MRAIIFVTERQTAPALDFQETGRNGNLKKTLNKWAAYYASLSHLKTCFAISGSMKHLEGKSKEKLEELLCSKVITTKELKNK